MNKYQKAITSLAVTGVLLSASPAMTSLAAPAQPSSQEAAASLNGVDSKIVTAVQKKLEEITGKAYTFSKAEPSSMGNDSGWIFEVQGLEYSEVMVQKNGELTGINIEMNWSDLKDSFKQEMKAALQQVFPDKNTQVDKVSISVQYNDQLNSGAISLSARADKTIIILENGQLVKTYRHLANEEVDNAVLKAAQDELSLNGLKNGPLNTASLAIENGKEVYTLIFGASDSNQAVVEVEKGTNKATIVSDHDELIQADGESPVPNAGEIKVSIDGQSQSFEQPPVIIDGNTLVPLRAIFEKLGAKIDWNDKEQSVTAKKGTSAIYLKIGDKSATVNGANKTLEVPAQIVNGHTMVPVRFIGEALGSDVKWEASSRTVIITNK